MTITPKDTAEIADNTINEQEEETQGPMTPDWWNDLYTDAFGNNYSDADPGL